MGIVFYLTLPNLLRELEEMARKLPHQAVQLEELGQDAVGIFAALNCPPPFRKRWITS